MPILLFLGLASAQAETRRGGLIIRSGKTKWSNKISIQKINIMLMQCFLRQRDHRVKDHQRRGYPLAIWMNGLRPMEVIIEITIDVTLF